LCSGRSAARLSPLLRELRELYYLQTTPVILDDAKLHRFLGTLQNTPYPEGIRRTMDLYAASRHAGGGLPGGGPA
jgi:hypothetical protein